MSKNIIITEKQVNSFWKTIKQIKKVNSGLLDGLAENCDYKIGFENNSPLEYGHVIGSAEPIAEEVMQPEDVDLSSFEIKDTLNPKLWKNGKLDSRIRLKLLDIADKFIENIEMNINPIDIVITGSLANYNWDETYSDIDLHIIVDFASTKCPKRILKDYFDSKKKVWNEQHDNITIYGFPVELYVQDLDEIHTASGIYSLERNRWLVKPNKKKLGKEETNEDYVREAVAEYMNIIGELSERMDNAKDQTELASIGQDAKKWKKRLKMERKTSLANGGKEYSDGNIIFKTLRRNGYIEKLNDIANKSFDLAISLI